MCKTSKDKNSGISFPEGEIDFSKLTEGMTLPKLAPPDMSRKSLLTSWGKSLNPEKVLQEYPRPQLVRDSYWNLNGYWDCAFSDSETVPGDWQKILVPFSPEACLSGVKRVLQPGEFLWYRRPLPDLPEQKGRILLHFGAVDWCAEVFVNGILAVRHEGGYTPFTADITELLSRNGNKLVVKVQDDTDASWHSHGKQRLNCGDIWYTPQSGIWQTVWLEQVPERYITDLRITPLFDEQQLELTVFTSEPEGECRVSIADKTVTVPVNAAQKFSVAGMEPWSPEKPCLHFFTVQAGKDTVQSYFALRKTEVCYDENGIKRLYLNGKPYFHTGLLDQGYYPDGLYTAPSDEAMVYDISIAKEMGFNMLRKHVKVEPLRWYYHCDRLGMLVWQDMVNGGSEGRPEVIYGPMLTHKHEKDNQYELFGRQEARGREEYNQELEETVKLLYNSPSVVMWVPFNEGWGQFDAAEAVSRIECLDQTRTIDHASGWNDQGIGLFSSWHVYMKKYCFEKDIRNRAVILTEYGGYTHRVENHCFSNEWFGYARFDSPEELLDALTQLFEQEILPAKQQGLTAAVYTQLTDVEGELNGLVTYDRRICKIPVEAVAKWNALLRDQE